MRTATLSLSPISQYQFMCLQLVGAKRDYYAACDRGASDAELEPLLLAVRHAREALRYAFPGATDADAQLVADRLGA